MQLNDEAIYPYMDLSGLVHMMKVDPVTRDPVDRNGVAYTSMWYMLLCLHKRLEDFEVERFSAIMRDRMQMVEIAGYQRFAVMLSRGPGQTDQEGQDDYLWLLAASAILGVPWIANNILWYGMTQKPQRVKWYLPKVRFFYNNVRPGTNLNERGEINESAWLGRYPAFVPHLKFAAKVRPTWFERWRWRAALNWSIAKPISDSDTWTQSWAMVQTYMVSGQRDEATDKAVRAWWVALKTKEPRGMRAVAFPEHPYHPITLAWEDFED